jgi:transcriptional regulator with XRE-family HTH domain
MTLMMLRMDAGSTVLEEAEGPLEEFSQVFGSRLTQLRRVRGWKQRELSRRAEIDPGRLSKLERGVARVSVPELIRLSLAMGTGLDELVFGSAVSLEGEWHRLLGELEKAGGSRAVDCATRLLQALVLGYHMPAGTPLGRAHEEKGGHAAR